jgi:transcriptional/translational regulatory protein YebC/TACO1
MSGHNKWSKIKNQKAVTDGQKSKLFTKSVRLLTVESKKAHGDMNAPGLITAIKKAREVNMPNDNIERAIKKASSEPANMDNITDEAYGPGGCAIVIEALTDNRNKAAQEVKHILTLHGTALAGIGAATWAFEKTHEGWVPKTTVSVNEEDGQKLGELVDALEENDEVQAVYTNAE